MGRIHPPDFPDRTTPSLDNNPKDACDVTCSPLTPDSPSYFPHLNSYFDLRRPVGLSHLAPKSLRVLRQHLVYTKQTPETKIKVVLRRRQSASMDRSASLHSLLRDQDLDLVLSHALNRPRHLICIYLMPPMEIGPSVHGGPTALSQGRKRLCGLWRQFEMSPSPPLSAITSCRSKLQWTVDSGQWKLLLS